MQFEQLSVGAAVESALEAATHLTTADAGAVAALRALARKIDQQDAYFSALEQQADERGSRPPSVDNVSIPTFLKYCESLGLTPNGRKAAPAPQAEQRPAEPVGLGKFGGLKLA